jgi:Tol biopolymer transport system component
MIGELEAGGTRMRAPQRLTLDDRADWPTGWLRDSRQVLFYSDRNGNFDVFKQDVNAPMPELIAHGPEHERGAQLSPDGNWILFFSSPEPSPGTSLSPERLMRVPVSGGSPQFVLEAGGFPGPPPISSERTPLDRRQYPGLRCSTSSAGRCVLGEANERQFVFSEFHPMNGSKRELARLDMDPSILFVWDLSPDGSRIAVTERMQQNGRIRIVDLTTKAVHELSIDWANLDSIGWSADGQALFVTSYSSRGETLLHVALDREVHLLYKYSTWFERPFASPDGRYLAFAQLRYDSNAWMIDNFR